MAISLLDGQALIHQQDFSNLNKKVYFFDFQPQAKQALDLFLQSEFGSLLVIKSELFP